MTKKQSEVLAHIIAGGEIINSDDIPSTLSGVMVEDHTGDQEQISMDMLGEFEIYIHPLQKEVDRLKAIIEMQNGKFQEIAQKEKATSGRKSYVRLTTEEQKELCEYARKNPHENKSSIARKFEISDSNCNRILDENGIRKMVKRT